MQGIINFVERLINLFVLDLRTAVAAEALPYQTFHVIGYGGGLVAIEVILHTERCATAAALGKVFVQHHLWVIGTVKLELTLLVSLTW